MEDARHGSCGKRKIGATRRLVALFFLALSSWSVLASLGVGIIGLTVPRPAEAQISGWDHFVFGALAGPGGAVRAQRGEFAQSAVQRFLGAGGVFGSGNPPPSSDGGGLGGGLGGLFGRLFENPALLALLVILLTQLFQGGGATPQEGPVEEQPPLPPGIGPQQTGPLSPIAAPGSVLYPIPACAFRVTDAAITPASCTMQRGETLRIVNEAAGNRTIYSDPHDPAGAAPGNITEACRTLNPTHACRVTFQQSGTFGFHIHEVPQQHATVTVQ